MKWIVLGEMTKLTVVASVAQRRGSLGAQ
jgi:hypothetical protein